MPDAEPILTEADRAILRALQSNAGLTNQQIAERVNMSPSACWRRTQALEQAGVIAGQVVLLDPERLGLRFTAITRVSLATHERDSINDFVQAVLARPEVLQCFGTTGDTDVVLRVVTRDIQEYERFLTEFIFRQRCVSQVNTSVVMRTFKDTTALPV